MPDKHSRLLIVLLILSASRLPLPWGHTHAGLDGPRLAEHLRQYHSTDVGVRSPQGWHLHLFPLLVDEIGGHCVDHPANTEEISFERRAELLRSSAEQPCLSGAPPSWNDSQGGAAVGKLSPANACRQQHTHQLLNVLLI